MNLIEKPICPCLLDGSAFFIAPMLTESRRYFHAAMPAGCQWSFSLPDVRQDGQTLFVSKQRYNEVQARVLALSASGQPVSLPPVETKGTALAPTEADLERINQEALIPLSADDVIVYERYVLNNQPSRTGLRFTLDALERLAADYAAGRTRALLDRLPDWGHSGAGVVGATFAAEVVDATVRGIEGKWIKTREYIPKAAIASDHLSLITSGVLRFDSVGILGGGMRFVEQEGIELIEIFDDPEARIALQAREITFVYLGEIKGAGSSKGLEAAATGKPKPTKTWAFSF